MPKVELMRGIVWDKEAKKEGDIITCTKAQAKWLENRDVGLEVDEADEETKPVARKKRAKKIED